MALNADSHTRGKKQKADKWVPLQNRTSYVNDGKGNSNALFYVGCATVYVSMTALSLIAGCGVGMLYNVRYRDICRFLWRDGKRLRGLRRATETSFLEQNKENTDE